jgi:hypothetical protein
MLNTKRIWDKPGDSFRRWQTDNGEFSTKAHTLLDHDAWGQKACETKRKHFVFILIFCLQLLKSNECFVCVYLIFI